MSLADAPWFRVALALAVGALVAVGLLWATRRRKARALRRAEAHALAVQLLAEKAAARIADQDRRLRRLYRSSP